MQAPAAEYETNPSVIIATVPFPLLAIMVVLVALLVVIAVYYLIRRWL